VKRETFFKLHSEEAINLSKDIFAIKAKLDKDIEVLRSKAERKIEILWAERDTKFSKAYDATFGKNK
jgi:Skp family chaperone for outer membrane proteins